MSMNFTKLTKEISPFSKATGYGIEDQREQHFYPQPLGTFPDGADYCFNINKAAAIFY